MAQALSHCVSCDIKNPISWKCLDCDFSMCDTCKTSHERFPATKQHVIKKVKEINSDDMKLLRIYQQCTVHNRDISMYCSSCKLFVCVHCIAENHGKHDLDTIQSIVEEKLKDAETVIQDATVTKDFIASEMVYIKEIEKTVEENSTKTYEAMKERESEMTRAIKEQFLICASKLEMQKRMAIETILEHQQKLAIATSETDNVILSLKRCIENKDIITLIIQTSELKERLQSLNVSYGQTIPVFTFMEGENGIFGNIQTKEHISKRTNVSKGKGQANQETDTKVKGQENIHDWHAPDSSICHHKSSSKRMFYTCGHKFCTECIHERNCPVCRKNYDVVENTYIYKTKIKSTKDENVYKIVVFPGGHSGLLENFAKFVGHPSVYNKWLMCLPTTPKASLVLELLRIALDRGLVFKRGNHVELSSKELSVIIHPRRLPDPEPVPPEILDSVILYLESQGVTEIDI